MQLSAGFINGFNAYLAGIKDCPYANVLNAEALDAWERGWREARYTKAELYKTEPVEPVVSVDSQAEYEYKHICLSSSQHAGGTGLEVPLNRLAKEGWRVKAVVEPSKEACYTWEFLLERKLHNRRPNDTK